MNGLTEAGRYFTTGAGACDCGDKRDQIECVWHFTFNPLEGPKMIEHRAGGPLHHTCNDCLKDLGKGE